MEPPTGAEIQLLAQICSLAKQRSVSVSTNTLPLLLFPALQKPTGC